ncbi:UBQ11 [Symbiodinium natans]|uniref:UBQ11 protein n=1 Tax=Symbiodinium natans TaxID=878477 RepID=A0A812TQ08_9DINO|nr:UBQ11 [Symbiodinium natans]
MGRPTSIEQKLDMALDELVKTEDPKSGRKSSSYGPAGKKSGGDRDRDGPYAAGRGDGKGKGKGRQRLPPEEKALLKTQCFFNAEKELVIKLYETEVLIVKNRKETPPVADSDKTEKSPAPAGGSLVLTLNSGGFRTAETKAILNEALRPLALRVEGSESSWSLCSDYRMPGQVTDGSKSQQPFEDGMEITVPAVVTPEAVREHMAGKRQAAKSAVDAQRARARCFEANLLSYLAQVVQRGRRKIVGSLPDSKGEHPNPIPLKG